MRKTFFFHFCHEKLLLGHVGRSSVRKDLVIKINSLCEQFSPNNNWYVRTMNKLYEMGGDLITADLSNKFI